MASGRTQGGHPPPLAHANSHSQGSLTGSRLLAGEEKRQSAARRQQQQHQHQHQQQLLAANESSGHSTQNPRTASKRPRVRDLVAERHSTARQNSGHSAALSSHHASHLMADLHQLQLQHQHLQQQQQQHPALALPLLKPKTTREAAYKCDKAKEAPNRGAEDSEAPLNLCMKRSAPSASRAPVSAPASAAASFATPADLSRRSHGHGLDRRGVGGGGSGSGSGGSDLLRAAHMSRVEEALGLVAAASAANAASAGALQGLANCSESALYPKKRGRKPKSLLASSSAPLAVPLTATAAPATAENKPRRRGRPPLLSPPPGVSPGCPGQRSEGQAKASPADCSPLISSHRLTAGAFDPNANPANLLQPGWPTFSATGQIIFPAKLNGGSLVDSLQRRASDVRDSLVSGGSGEESRVSDSASERGPDEGSDSQDSAARRADDGEAAFHASRPPVDENEIRIPLEYG